VLITSSADQIYPPIPISGQELAAVKYAVIFNNSHKPFSYSTKLRRRLF